MRESISSDRQQVTQLLRDWHQYGSNEAVRELSPILYETMRRLSSRYIRQEKQGYTLQATELVHEAYALLVNADIDWQNRHHFYAVAAKTMRRILVDRAREKNAIKRGQGLNRVTFEESSIGAQPQGDDILALEQVLQELHEQDSRKAEIIELYFYAGLTYNEIALCLNISEATVDRELRFTKAWLAKRLA